MHDDNRVHKIEAAFATVESRVQALVNENRELKKRLHQLEEELAGAGHTARDLEQLQMGRLQIRQKVESVLLSLEALKE